ncbi:S9 family peptidase [Salidesulfovibrio onnuriiensis]|uniref:S9 family peptidase n=1 Tax=Salidesulfovibrio onnuriiensis TaxID=2583823 RepID=UPI0011C84864|nr:prolyl oligopeptidase family serine peptidase [Salidesulfovibrio onnuriiensis]
MNKIFSTLLAAAAALLLAAPCAANISDYQTMPDLVRKIINVPEQPKGVPSPDGENLLLIHYGELFSVEELTRPTVGLAGILIDTKSNSRRPLNLARSLGVYDLDDGEKRQVTNLPEGSRLAHISWAPNGKHIAMTVYRETGLELWVADLGSLEATRLSELRLNDILGTPYVWSPDGRSLLALTVPEERTSQPEMSKHKFGPKVRDSVGTATPARTYQHLLQSGYDILLFEYLATSRISEIKLNGEYRDIGSPGLFKSISPSPDGKYLLTETIHRPYSYTFPVGRFPYSVEIVELAEGRTVRLVDDLHLASNIPTAPWGVRKGARYSAWNPAEDAELWWVESRDAGGRKKDASIRDEILSLKEPFDAEPASRLAMPDRFRALYWGREDFIVATGTAPGNGTTSAWIVKSAGENPAPQDNATGWKQFNKRQLHPMILSEHGPFKQYRLSPDEEKIYLTERDTSLTWERNVLFSLDLETGVKELVWLGNPNAKESPIQPMDKKGETWLVLSESFTSPPNYFIRKRDNTEVARVTSFVPPVPELLNVRKEHLEYQRLDGVRLAGDLYLPPGYETDNGTLPVLVWIYPREYANRDAAEKAVHTSKSFMRLGRTSRMFWPLMGYALLDSPTMPIIGSERALPNDTFLDQLSMDAQAAVDELVRIGVAAPDKIAVGGHSYGAFSTANLLAHTRLFAAGIARSGAYNRSLTPFGFQREHRTFWTEPDLYKKMSPFFYVSGMKNPVLLIHGEHDQNAGTFPEQSERLYQALVGLGKTARLVMLPHEGHSYYGKESIMHMIWEMKRWLDIHLKGETEAYAPEKE